MSLKENKIFFKENKLSLKDQKMFPQETKQSLKDNKNSIQDNKNTFQDNKMSFQAILNKSAKNSVISHVDTAKKGRPSLTRKGKKKTDQLFETAGSNQDKSSDKPPSLYSYKPSVEEYFAEGMERYRLELELEANEWSHFGSTEREQTPSSGLLGDVLDRQLCNLEMITRACQTDWKWLLMAVRWRHARIINSSLPQPPRAPTAIEYDLDATHVASAVSCKHHASSSQEHVSKILRIKRSKASSLGHQQHRHKDKCVDTSDLDFNAFDNKLRYTPTQTRMSTGKFLAHRSSSMIFRWKDIARSTIISQHRRRSLKTGSTSSSYSGRSTISVQSANDRPDSPVKDDILTPRSRSRSSSSEEEQERPARLRFTETVLVEEKGLRPGQEQGRKSSSQRKSRKESIIEYEKTLL